MRAILFTWLSIALSLMAIACDGSSNTDVKQAYPKYTETTRMTYTRELPGGGQTPLNGLVIGHKTIGDKEYLRLEIAPEQENERVEIWGNLLNDSRVEFIGAEYDSAASAGALGVSTYASFELDEPLVIELGGSEGRVQSIEVNGQAVLGATGNAPETAQVTGSLTLVERGVGVDTTMGFVSDCLRYEVDVTLPLLFGADTRVTASIWTTENLGLVKATFGPPVEGLGLGYTGSSDTLDLGDGWFSMQTVTLLDSAKPSMSLSTYDRQGVFDADKNDHAKMLLEIRWADQAQAATEEQPPVQVEFGTVFGVFPHQLLASGQSFFHPEENEEGFTHWVAYVDQAAKNENENGIVYRIDVSCPTCAAPIRITSRIIYKVFEGE